jgi:hypothetical protein
MWVWTSTEDEDGNPATPPTPTADLNVVTENTGGCPAESTTKCIRVDFAAHSGKSNTWGGFTLKFSSQQNLANRGCNKLVFYVKGAIGTEVFKVKMNSTNLGNSPVERTFTATPVWQKCEIDLNGGVFDKTQATEPFILAFEQGLIATATSATIYLDYIGYEE